MILVQDVTKIYTTYGDPVEALNNITLELPKTGFLCVVGPSGCGKTTLLNLLGGLDQPSSGTIYLSGVNTQNFDDASWNAYRNQEVGFVFQNYFLIPHLNILKNVELPLAIAGYSKEKRTEAAKEQIHLLGLESKAYKKPQHLSGGQQQKAAIARALVLNPKIILADEPTGSLDHDAAISIMEILKEISQNRLVVMVTHQLELAKKYATRIIEMKDGTIIHDKNNLIEQEKQIKKPALKPAHMKFSTSFFLSFHNLIQRKYRTLLTTLSASIGIMGMLLVLSVAFGFNRYIESRKQETLNAFPIKVERISFVVPFFDKNYIPNLPVFPDDDIIYPRNIQYEFQTINTLTAAYYTHVLSMDPNLYDYIHYDFRLKSNFAVENQGIYTDPQDYIKQVEVNQDYMMRNFDILKGYIPEDTALSALLVLDRYNRLSKDIAQALGFSGDDPINFDELMDLSIKWIPNQVMYTKVGSLYQKNLLSSVISDPFVLSIPVAGIVRIKDTFELDYLKSGIYYTTGVTDMILADSLASDIVSDQLSANQSVLDGQPLNTAQKDTLLRNLGYATYPQAYAIYSSSFEDKDRIVRYLKSYNDTVSINQAIEPLDLAGIGLATMRTAIDSTTLILIVFSGISLLISNLMIGIMTYTSVIERTKEIGMLRAIGARKKDVRNIFYSETLMIGFASGVIAILFAYLLMPLLNLLLEDITTIPKMTYLDFFIAFLMLLISMALTGLSGIIPAHIASKKDPITALKND
jgi:putative ABC transport system permease protein